MSNRVLALLATTGLLVGLPAAADGRRSATSSERAAIAKRIGVPSRCATVYVSTVDRRYASYQFNYRRKHCAKYGSNGIDILRRRDGRWLDLGGMSDCQGSTIRGVPVRVYRDLTDRYCNV